MFLIALKIIRFSQVSNSTVLLCSLLERIKAVKVFPHKTGVLS
jgi:hypothetical protein